MIEKEYKEISGKWKYQCLALFKGKNGIDYGCLLGEKHKGKHIRQTDLGLELINGSFEKVRPKKYEYF